MKKYIPYKMMAKSRFCELFPTLSTNEQEQILLRMQQYINENPQYNDAGNYGHLCNIYSAIALYDVLGRNQSAYDRVSHTMWEYVEARAGVFRKVLRHKGVLRLMGKLLPTLFAKGSGYGWQYEWHTDKVTDRYLQFECHKCIYQQIFSKYGVPELGPAFCHCDDINYGHIPGTTFTRKHTLCRDGQPCDFLFTR